MRARRECRRISRKTILALQKIRNGRQSGEDSPLRNTWDEICVQVQSEESIFWGLYRDTIEGSIADEVERLDVPTKESIWLQTEGYEYWDEEENTESVPWVPEDIIRYILGKYVLSAAEDWHNRTIEGYLNL